MQTYLIEMRVDQKWFDAIDKFTADVYENEICQWIRVEGEE